MRIQFLGLTAAAILAAAAFPLAQTPSQPPTVDSVTFGDLKLRAIGPTTTSGRISAVEAQPDNPLVLYAGTAGGGLWKSSNGGVTFSPVFDEHVMSIGAIAIDPSKTDTVWVGTGESWVRNSVSVGRGVFKSTDAGQTWRSLGLEDTERIAKIIVHPKSADTAYVCAVGHLWNANDERGVFKTTDGGKTWAKVLFVNADTGCGDLEMDPQEPNTLYAGMWQVRRLPYFFTSGGPGSGFYKTTDGGKNWTKITRGLPEGDLGRIGIAVAPSRPGTLYALVEAKSTALYRSDDAGESWKRTMEGENPYFIRARPFYFSNIVVDPSDHLRVYVPTLFLSMTSNGGRSFEFIGVSNVGGINIHPDLHQLWINPKDPHHLILGTDGGVYVSRDRGRSWVFGAALPVGQFYHVTVDMQRPYRVYGGLQDNGSWSAPSRALGAPGIRNRNWENVGVGDGFNVFADPRDPSIVFSEYQGAQIRRATLRTGEMKDIRPHEGAGDPEYRFNWNAAFAASPTDPTVIYLGSQFLFRSRDRGDSWERISPDLTTNDKSKQRQRESGGLTPDNTTAENYCTIVSLAESPVEAGVIWAGTDDGNLQVTRDGGRNWTNVVKNVPGLPANTWVSMVEAGRHARGAAFATFDGHRAGDMKTYVYATDDYGKTWRPIAKGLEGYAFSIRQDPVKPNLLFAGTEFGLFISIDGGANWARVTSLPRVAVHDITIHPRDNDLVIATHGRGIQILDDITPLRALTADTLAKSVAVLPSRPAVQSVGATMQDFPGDAEYVAANPPDGAYIAYYLKERHVFGTLKVEVLDSSGKVVQSLAPGTRQGINRIFWNMRLPAPKSAAAPGLGARALSGPMVPEGKYTIRVTKDDQVVTGTLDLLPDPLGAHPPAARAERQALLMRLYGMQADLAYVADATTDLRDRLRAASGVLKKKDANAPAAADAESLAADLDALHKTLVDRTGLATAADPQLREHVIDLYGSVLSFGGAPTTSQSRYADVLTNELKTKRQKFDELTGGRLAAVNAKITAAGGQALKAMTREEFDKKP